MTQPFQPASRRRPRSAHAKLFGTGQLSRGTHCAVIVAHPADEVIGAGCLISKLVDVNVLHITDGATRNNREAQSLGFKDWRDYAHQRQEETAAALSLVQVRPEQIIELGIENHNAAQHLAELTKKITNFLQHSGADIVITHPYEGGHPDHDATAFATHSAIELLKLNGVRPPVLFEMALHPNDEGEGRSGDFLTSPEQETTTLLLDDRSLELKQRMFDHLVTQRRSLEDSELDAEKFRQPKKYDFTAPPQEGPLHYENLAGSISGHEWVGFANEALRTLFPQKAVAH
jgi:N-acetylglucosamine malate deacetylase 2